MKEQSTPFSLRLPTELRQHLEAEADIAGRSLNAEIVARLHKSTDTQIADQPSHEKITSMLQELEQRMDNKLNQAIRDLLIALKT